MLRDASRVSSQARDFALVELEHLLQKHTCEEVGGEIDLVRVQVAVA